MRLVCLLLAAYCLLPSDIRPASHEMNNLDPITIIKDCLRPFVATDYAVIEFDRDSLGRQ